MKNSIELFRYKSSSYRLLGGHIVDNIKINFTVVFRLLENRQTQQVTGCPLYNSTGRHVSVYLDHHQVLRARAYSI